MYILIKYVWMKGNDSKYPRNEILKRGIAGISDTSDFDQIVAQYEKQSGLKFTKENLQYICKETKHPMVSSIVMTVYPIEKDELLHMEV